MMKNTIFTFALMLCVGFCLAAEPNREFAFGENDIPTIREEPNFTMSFDDWILPVILNEPHVEVTIDVLEVSRPFHFTRIWWLRDQLYYIEKSKDEAALKEAKLRYDLAVAQLMNDVLWMGGPRECVTVDEPE